MGKIKLTLTVENQIIERAKKVAREKNISLSSVIEKYLINDFLKAEKVAKISLAEKLGGIAKSKFGEKTDKEIKEMMLKDKHEI